MGNYASEYRRLDQLFDDLFPITRSITGPGFRASLKRLNDDIPLVVESVPTGAEVFDWVVPPEWRIHEARLTGPEGTVYADYDESNLSIVNYSAPVDLCLSLDELNDHLYTDSEAPDAIPYVTSYYDRNWGFCLPHSVYEELPKGEYHAYIDTEFVDGELNYGHTTLTGNTDQEILLSTYLCHPTLANNELSGPLVMSSIYRRLEELDEREYTYRFVVVPETIGSLTYLWRYGEELQEKLVGGLVLTCLGGPKETLSYKRSRQGDTILDDLVDHLKNQDEYDFRIRDFTPTDGSDERQYCSPGFNLPVGQMARTVYGNYEEYHNSNDDKEFMGIDTIIESADVIETLLGYLEFAGKYENQKPYGEPMLSKRNLYTDINSPSTRSYSTNDLRDQGEFIDKILVILNYSDGENTMVDIAERFDYSIEELIGPIRRLEEENLLERI